MTRGGTTNKVLDIENLFCYGIVIPWPLPEQVPRRSSKNVWSRLLGDLYKPVTATPVTDMQRPSQRPIAKPDLESHSSSGVLTMEDDKVDVFKLPLVRPNEQGDAPPMS